MHAGEEIYIRRDVKVRAFRTYHVIPSQGYVVYSVKEKLKQDYMGLPGNKIRDLKLSGVEITYTTTTPEVAFTGDTTSDFIHDENNADVLRAKILIMEVKFPCHPLWPKKTEGCSRKARVVELEHNVNQSTLM